MMEKIVNGKPTLRKCLRPPWRLVWPGSASSNYKGGWKNVQRLDENYVEQQLMRPDVDRGKLWDANPSHGRRARVGKDIWLRCDSHLGSTIFNSSCQEFWVVKIHRRGWVDEDTDGMCCRSLLSTYSRPPSCLWSTDTLLGWFQWWKALKNSLLLRHQWQ